MKISKYIKIKFLLVVIFSSMYAEDIMPLSFTHFYPKSPMKNFVSLTMRLWSEVKAAHVDETILQKMLKESRSFAHNILLLNSTLDMVLLDASEKVHECSECMDHVLHDFRYIIGVIYSLSNEYNQLVEHIDREDVMTTKFVLHSIIGKIQKVLEDHQVASHMYVFYSKEITPLLVPAMIDPVAPID